MKKSKRLIFFGTENFSAPALEALLAADWPVAAVVTKPDSPAGRGQKTSAPKVKEIAEKHKVKVLQPDKVSLINSAIEALEPDYGVLVAYGKIIPQSTLDLFPGGIINLHPSLLPLYRGPAPIEAAILNGDKDTGVSLMRLVAAMDAGPVYDQKRVELNGHETKPELYEKLAAIGAEFLLERLEAITEGWLMPKPQIEREASYTKLIKKADGMLDFNLSAYDLERQIRAYAGWPGSHTKIWGLDVTITAAHAVTGISDGPGAIEALDEGVLMLHTDDGYLCIDSLKPAGKAEMSAADFIRGYQKK